MVKDQKGFTLLEMLFVLSILSILFLLFFPFQKKSLESFKEKQFLNSFHKDVLYIQNLAMTTTDYVAISFSKEKYYVNRVNQGIIFTRKIPKTLKIKSNTVGSLSFNHKGTIRKPGSIQFQSKDKLYNYICPLGKGRCYFEK